MTPDLVAAAAEPTCSSSKTQLDLIQEYAKQVISDHDLGHGFDVTVEASGAEVCAQMAVCMLKAGGTCEPLTSGKTSSTW